MGKAKTKKRQPTKRRSVFLEAVEIIKRHDIDGTVDLDNEDGFINAAEELEGLLDKAKHSGWLSEPWAICSALWVSQQIVGGLQSLDECHEQCRGARMFLVAYWLGRRSGLRAAEKYGDQS